MKSRYFPMLGSLLAFTATGPLLLPLPASGQAEQEQAEANPDVEVLTRGPVHEAFAEAVSYEAEAGVTINSAPPELIEELPPDQQPDGENVTWIPGYWGWDDEASNFLWISGVWRNIPPGRQWVPGYWNELGGSSYQWISGYWADTTTEEVEYVETAPPKSIDAGPNIAAPSEDHNWVPGNWMWSSSRYVWRPGYWLALRPNWTWVPSRYCYSPRGYTYVDGYWDYAVMNRGVLFAPVHFRGNAWSTPGYRYTPSLVVSLSVFADHLFIRPRGHHYYFGDYYAPRYADRGYYSSFNWHRNHHRGYDPIYAYQRWDHRHDRNWERRHEDNYNYFRDNDRARPPHTWAAMRGLRNEKFDDDRGRSRMFANSFDGFVKSPGRDMKFRPVDKDRREKIVAERQEMRTFTRQRRDMESKTVATTDGTPRGDRADRGEGGEKQKGVFREKLRRSPVVGRQAEQFAQNEAPPKRPEARGNKAILKGGDAVKGSDAADATPGRGQGRDMTKRDGEGEKVTPERVPGRGQGKADGTNEPKVTPNERERRAPGQDTEGKPQREKATPEREVQPKPDREKATPERQVKPKPEREKVAPERQVQPKPEREKATPERQVQPKPERQVQPKPQREVQPKPERQVQPKPERQVQPQRQVPERKAQPERQVQPRQPQVKPQVKPKGKDKEEARQVPQRRPESSVQRIAQPKPQVQARPQPQQRQVQPRQQQARPQPQQRQVEPRQQQARPQPQQRQVQPPKQQARPQPQQRQAQPRQQQVRPQPQQRQGKDKKDRDKEGA
ncbi:hypothetical protein OKA05_05460 [Luteolibacter arcticus]|uniref:YXWGXW repeat-containing protein n=1 Tax=Luteolibacter arcticus TaxID=1581411 RepID=A0ABT3GEE8_9BACT|nr:hypothetical protein [Luteolibacter arcticus]MCW1921989.1 hypothetical protein [Luteolibacter arcticus]